MFTKTPVFKLLLGSLFLLATVSCGGEDDGTPSGPVTGDFTVDTDIATDGSGTVSFSASGSNVSYYEYFFGENSGQSAF
ncbi:MAG: hypothetical protein WBH03_17560, partial [Cyclobacteriaceae bacterium]